MKTLINESTAIHLNDLLDDLSLKDYRDLISYLAGEGYRVTRANIKGWRKKQGKETDD